MKRFKEDLYKFKVAFNFFNKVRGDAKAQKYIKEKFPAKDSLYALRLLREYDFDWAFAEGKINQKDINELAKSVAYDPSNFVFLIKDRAIPLPEGGYY